MQTTKILPKKLPSTRLYMGIPMVILSLALLPGAASALWQPSPDLLEVFGAASPDPLDIQRGAEKGAPLFTIDYSASKDNTICEEDGVGGLGNGAGDHLFSGRTLQGSGEQFRRALLAFNLLPSLPSDALITNVTLRLEMSKTISGALDVALHRATTAWGEGTSDASGDEGACAAATAGDADWTEAIVGTSGWIATGGDFDASATALTSVDGNGSYTWSGKGLIADVQAFVDGTFANEGWFLIGDETVPGTAKRFDSRTHPTAANRPVLSVSFESNLYQVFADGFENNGTASWSTAVGLPD